MNNITIVLSVAAGRENEVPRDIAERLECIITNAFTELFNEGILDYTTNVLNVYNPEVEK